MTDARVEAKAAYQRLSEARRRHAPLQEIAELEHQYVQAEIAGSRIRHAHRSGTSAGRIDRQAGHQAAAMLDDLAAAVWPARPAAYRPIVRGAEAAQ